MKHDWLKIRLTPAQSRASTMQTIMDACLPLVVAAGFPEDAAMFAQGEPGVGTDLLFSPRMAGIVHPVLAAHDTVATEMPTRDERTAILIANGGVRAFALLKEKPRR